MYLQSYLNGAGLTVQEFQLKYLEFLQSCDAMEALNYNDRGIPLDFISFLAEWDRDYYRDIMNSEMPKWKDLNVWGNIFEDLHYDEIVNEINMLLMPIYRREELPTE